MPVGQEWVQLQRKIFSRWCKQKLNRRHDIKVVDIVEDCKDPAVLIALIEELSETKYGAAAPKQGATKGRIRQIEQLNNALSFCWKKGVELKMKPSAEQIADGDEASILALVFAIMMKFMKIGDDDESEKLNAKDALLLWCKNKCAGLEKVGDITGFKKVGKAPFHTGAALCGIIHKYRPALVPEDAAWTVELAQDAALEYFGLEKFITPAEVAKLDEQSMVVYVSEFYYGIMEQRKVDLAARRITKLIKLTVENDRLKAEYNKTAAEYKERLTRVEAVLEDRTIDDTMAGAKRRLEEFYKYKTDDKNVLLANQLSLEALFNNLAMRLAHHKRPEFVPPEGVSLKDVEAALHHLEIVEQERSVALHAELNRQIKLVEINGQHTTLHENIMKWAAEKQAYLEKKEIIESVSAAQFALRTLEAYDKESAAMRQTNIAQLCKIGAELASERYEGIEGVKTREAEVDAMFKKLDELSAAKHPVLDDDLAREMHKEKVRLMFRNHTEKNDALNKWIQESSDYLQAREQILNTADAHTHISLLAAFENEKRSMLDTAVAELKQLGADIIAAVYKTQYSEWSFEQPDVINERAAHADSEWERLAELSAEKKRVLEDHLAREELHERTQIVWKQHCDRYAQLEKWINNKEKYLTTWPEIHNVADALIHLGVFSSYEQENGLTRQTQVVELSNLSQTLRDAKHESTYSSYVFEHVITHQPEYEHNDEESRRLVDEHEKWVLDKFDELAELAKKFKAVLDDHLAREEYAAKARIVGLTHDEKYKSLEAYAIKTEEYLKAREDVHSVAEAKNCMTQIESVEKELKRMREIHVVEFRRIAADVLGRKYETEYSNYQFDESDTKLPETHFGTPEPRTTVETRNKWVDDKYEELQQLAATKRHVLEDHLAREEYAAESRKLAAQHNDQFDKFVAWAAAKEEYLRAREEVTCIADCTRQLALLDAFNTEHEVMRGGEIEGLTSLGAELLARKYETELSSYSYEDTKYNEPAFEEHKPELRAAIQEHEKTVLAKWEELRTLSKEKSDILNLHLQREQFALQTRTQAQQHQDMYTRLKAWAEDKLAFLRAREEINSISLATTHITLLDQYGAEFKSMTETLCKEYKNLGANILSAKHETEIGQYTYEHTKYSQPDYDKDEPEKRAELEKQLAEVDSLWETLGNEEKTRRELLNDHLARETFAHEVRLLDHQHAKSAEKIVTWIGDRRKYLQARPEIDSVSEANTQLSILEGYDKDRVATESTSIASLAKLGDEILPKKYETALSSWVPENPDEIRGRLDDIKKQMDELATLRDTLKKDLDDALAREVEKERLRLEYAHLALEYTKFVRDRKADLSIETFGFTLEEVQEHGKVTEESRAQLTTEADNQIKGIKDVFDQGVAMGVKENVYSTITLADIDATRAELVQAIDARDERYKKELERQVYNDNLCKEFAGLADPFSKAIIDEKDRISSSKEDLEAQLAYVDKQLAAMPEMDAKLEPIKALAAKMEEAGITNIRHTTLTLRDVVVQREQFGKFLTAKRDMLAGEIENAKLKGITPEQFKEIDNMFQVFDKDHSSTLEHKELAACLYSLGEERSNKEITEIMGKYGNGKSIKYEGFKEFMIHVFGDSDTKDEVLEGFRLINRSESVANMKLMSSVQPKEDVEYITKTAPAVEGGWDFVAWVEDVFSR